MISGVVTIDRQAIVHLTVRGPAGQEHEIEAIVDTGFDGWLSLPSSLIVPLGLVSHPGMVETPRLQAKRRFLEVPEGDERGVSPDSSRGVSPLNRQ